MKSFLKILCIFLAILFTGSIALDFFISYRLRHSDTPKFRAWSYVYFDDTDYDIVINGASRAVVQYNPEIIDSVLGTNTLNLGIDGSCINRQVIKYKLYCRNFGRERKPRLLIQNIDFATIGRTSNYEREQFFPYFYYDKDIVEEFNVFEHFSFLERFMPLFRYNGYTDVIVSALKNKPIGGIRLYKGYSAADLSWDGSLFEQQESIQVSADSEALCIFDDFISDVVSNGTKIVFVYAPIYSGINNKIPDINVMFNLFGNIADKYKIPILNYNELPMCNDTTVFYNAMHMNKKGAVIFSNILAEDIDSLAILQ